MAEVLTLDDYSCSGSDDGGGSHFGSFYAERRGSNGSTPSDCKADKILAEQINALLKDSK